MKKYTGSKLNRIRFPLGGIGAGSVNLSGDGSFSDWEIFNVANKGSRNGYTHFAVRAVRGGKVVDARVLRGDQTTDLEGALGQGHFSGFGWGPDIPSMAGFPHFRNLTFTGSFPTAKLDFADEHFPGTVSLEAWSPFIPLEADDSSIPAAGFTITAENTSDEALDYTFAFSVSNPAKNFCLNRKVDGGVLLDQTGLDKSDLKYGNLCALTLEENTSVQSHWYRGSWFDALNIYWQQFTSAAAMPERAYEPSEHSGGETATVTVTCHAEPGETVSARFVLAWYYPLRCNDWSANWDRTPWRNWYATRWTGSEDAARYLAENWERLHRGTFAFRDALHDSDLPEEVIDAASSNLAVLRTPTCLRLEDGTFYGWEGVGPHYGSCEGTCTHVWSYAYALCYLFPSLERSIRDADYKYNQDDDGYMCFRMALPLGPMNSKFRACVDGQMLGVVKVLREWKLSGNDAWLAKVWPYVKKALAWAWNPKNEDAWDADCDGILEGRQHHTLDMELFGPSSWLEGIYLAALKAGAILARHEGDTEFAALCDKLYKNGSEFMEKELFNGQYYIQRVNLDDRSALERFGCVESYWNEEACELKYQIGEGSSIDQLLAQYHANLCGLGEIFDHEHLHTAIRSMIQNNYKSNLREFVNPCRLFALNDEGGTIICVYPDGVRKPSVPIPYAEECMTGFEYAFAVLAISEGFVEEGLACVRAIRDRYDGEKRNPFNEIECGSNYARSMASFALIPAMTGFNSDAVTGELALHPVSGSRAMFSCGTGWGEMEYSDEGMTLTLCGGFMKVCKLCTERTPVSVTADGKMLPLTVADDVTCPETHVTGSLVIKF